MSMLYGKIFLPSTAAMKRAGGRIHNVQAQGAFLSRPLINSSADMLMFLSRLLGERNEMGAALSQGPNFVPSALAIASIHQSNSTKDVGLAKYRVAASEFDHSFMHIAGGGVQNAAFSFNGAVLGEALRGDFSLISKAWKAVKLGNLVSRGMPANFNDSVPEASGGGNKDGDGRWKKILFIALAAASSIALATYLNWERAGKAAQRFPTRQEVTQQDEERRQQQQLPPEEQQRAEQQFRQRQEEERQQLEQFNAQQAEHHRQQRLAAGQRFRELHHDEILERQRQVREQQRAAQQAHELAARQQQLVEDGNGGWEWQDEEGNVGNWLPDEDNNDGELPQELPEELPPLPDDLLEDENDDGPAGFGLGDGDGPYD